MGSETDTFVSVQIAVAKLQERQDALQHRVRNAEMETKAVDDRLDKTADKTDLVSLEQRVARLEGAVVWSIRIILALGSTLVGVIYAAAKKLGLV